MRSDRERLLDILDAIERIKRQTAQGRTRFDQDEVLQTAVIRWIEIVGEAARGLLVPDLEAPAGDLLDAVALDQVAGELAAQAPPCRPVGRHGPVARGRAPARRSRSSP